MIKINDASCNTENVLMHLAFVLSILLLQNLKENPSGYEMVGTVPVHQSHLQTT